MKIRQILRFPLANKIYFWYDTPEYGKGREKLWNNWAERSFGLPVAVVFLTPFSLLFDNHTVVVFFCAAVPHAA